MILIMYEVGFNWSSTHGIYPLKELVSDIEVRSCEM